MKESQRVRLIQEIMEHCLVDKPDNFKLKDQVTDWTGTGELIQLSDKKLKKQAKKIMNDNLKELREA